MLIKLATCIDSINRTLGRTIAWLTLVMAIGMTFTVIQRYLFESNHIWQSELILYFHALVFLASAGYTLQSDSHVRVDIMYEKLQTKGKAIVSIAGTLCLLFPVAVAIAYFSHDFIMNSWQILEKSREYDGLPSVYILKSFIWLFSGTLFLQGISQIIYGVKAIRT